MIQKSRLARCEKINIHKTCYRTKPWSSRQDITVSIMFCAKVQSID